MVKWIQERYGAEVVTLTVDVGQGGLEEARGKAIQLGAAEAYVIDARGDFASHYVAKAIRANGLYQDRYPLSTALTRPLMAERAVAIARSEGVDAIAHGCTGKGNDQVRFEVSMKALASHVVALAPVREWDLDRESEVAYAERHGIPVGPSSTYSIDANLWGRSVECGVLEDPGHEAPSEIYSYTVPPEQAPDTAGLVEIEFEAGIPVALNDERLELVDLVTALNERAGRHAVGRIDMMEDRVVGLKSREIYECPAAVTLLTAHRDLERFCCTIHENEFKPWVDRRWAELVYKGLWHDPLREDLEALIEKVNEKVTGTVRVKLYKGHASVIARASENGIYDRGLATYDEGHSFDQTASAGFIDIWGLPTQVAHRRHQRRRVGGRV